MAYKTTLLWEETVYPISFVTYVQCAAFHKYVRIYSSIYCINNRLAFFSFFLQKKNNSMLVCRVVCCSHQSDRRIRICISLIRSPQQGMYLAPIRLSHQGMYLAPIGLPHLDILHQSQRLGIVFLQMISQMRGLCTKNEVIRNFGLIC